MPSPLSRQANSIEQDKPSFSFSEMRALLSPPKEGDLTASFEDWSQETHSRWVRKIFKEARERAEASPEETLLARILYAWRLTREMALLRDIISPDETLATVRQEDWAVPNYRPLSHGCLSRAHASPEAIACMENAQDLPDGFGQWCPETGRELKGFALVPPEPPIAYWGEDEEGRRHLHEDYDPENDRLLRLWSLAINHLSTAMGLGKGKIEKAFDPILGLYPLLDIQRTREAWPSRHQIVLFEMAIIEEVERSVVQGSIRDTKASLEARFGLLPYEMDCLLKVVKAKCREMMEGDAEDNRALMILRYEDYIARCREALDLSNEIKGMKSLATAMGIHKIEAKDMMKDILEMISAGAEKRKLEREQNLAMLEEADDHDTPSVGRREIVAEQRKPE